MNDISANQSHFFAHLSRMKLINRWPLMRNIRTENVQEHSLQVAMVAHALALIRNKYFDGDLDPNQVATIAMFHDVSEVITGDLPTPKNIRILLYVTNTKKLKNLQNKN